MFGSFGVWELLVILAIVVLLFGVGRLPQLGKGLGEGISNFRDSIKGKDKDAKAALEEKKEQHS